MVIHAPKPRPVAAGFWTFCDQTGDLRHVDAHADSTVCTRWPLLDRWHRNLIERGVDWLLNAAGAGRERLDAALRVPYPGSRLDRMPPIQSAFWYRMLHGVSGGAQVDLYLGDGKSQSHGGLVINQQSDSTTIAGWATSSSGPGGGATGSGYGYRGSGGGNGSGGGGGGYGQAGKNGEGGSGGGGVVVAAEWVFHALLTNTYSLGTLGLGGAGGAGGVAGSSAAITSPGGGGDSGDGLVRLSVQSLTEETSRSLAGSTGGNGGTQHYRTGGSGGGGSGGLYLAAVGRMYVLGTGVNIACPGGLGGTATRNGGNGGNGRVIICYGDSVDTSAGTISNAVLTTYQLLPSLPLGQVRVS